MAVCHGVLLSLREVLLTTAATDRCATSQERRSAAEWSPMTVATLDPQPQCGASPQQRTERCTARLLQIRLGSCTHLAHREQNDDGTNDRDDDRSDDPAARAADFEHTMNEPATENTAQNADNDGADRPTRRPAGNDHACDTASDQPNDQPNNQVTHVILRNSPRPSPLLRRSPIHVLESIFLTQD